MIHQYFILLNHLRSQGLGRTRFGGNVLRRSGDRTDRALCEMEAAAAHPRRPRVEHLEVQAFWCRSRKRHQETYRGTARCRYWCFRCRSWKSSKYPRNLRCMSPPTDKIQAQVMTIPSCAQHHEPYPAPGWRGQEG